MKISEIKEKDINVIASYMDDDIREDLHSKMAPCEPKEFLEAYLKVKPDFEMLLENEFNIKR